ncbi:hypothetical protein NDU88_003667 [Pleurodeles waltl]|uniref:Uncharacterized protein n=1 Tax=Pleurodeles waltl TaxID=8319 RepID=A0AAV7V330_PLEWA|nr:hypothetical protein NDU88_003667 [Pleurodeles waltl]
MTIRRCASRRASESRETPRNYYETLSIWSGLGMPGNVVPALRGLFVLAVAIATVPIVCSALNQQRRTVCLGSVEWGWEERE